MIAAASDFVAGHYFAIAGAAAIAWLAVWTWRAFRNAPTYDDTDR